MKKFSRYEIKGIEVPSVTTILNILDKPGLPEWYGRLGLSEANKQKNDAATYGSLVHNTIEYIETGLDIKPDHSIKKVINNFRKWSYENVDEWLAFEKACYHDELMYAGTLDCIARFKNGRIVLTDIKTSRSIRDTYTLQLAAYKNATRIEDCTVKPEEIEDAGILHLNKETEEWEWNPIELTSYHFTAFKCCRFLYTWRNGI